MNIGIIGQGFVGSAIREGLKNFYSIKAYDIDKCEYKIVLNVWDKGSKIQIIQKKFF